MTGERDVEDGDRREERDCQFCANLQHYIRVKKEKSKEKKKKKEEIANLQHQIKVSSNNCWTKGLN